MMFKMMILVYCRSNSCFTLITKEKLPFSLICSFYCCLVKRVLALQVSEQFAIWGLVAHELVTACKVSKYGVFPSSERYGVSLRAQSKYGKIRTRKKSVLFTTYFYFSDYLTFQSIWFLIEADPAPFRANLFLHCY